MPFQKKAALLSPAELAFFRVIETLDLGDYRVFVKVGLADLVSVKKGTEPRQSSQNRLNGRHADFVLCEAATMRPLLVIELDDSSHRTEGRRAKDAAKDSILQAAGLPILRVLAKRAYNTRDLADQIRQLIPPEQAIAGGQHKG